MTLPIQSVVPALASHLRAGHAILQAPTGSGKSTGVPLSLLEADWLAGRSIVMLEPRRAAARLTARRMAAVRGEDIGETVGYQVRFERRIGAHTRLRVVTEGILTRWLQCDPELTGVGLVIFDEFHERALNADLGLALTLDIATNLREDLRILVMSATLATEPLSALLGGAPVIRGEGQSHPVAIGYASQPPDPDCALAVARAARSALDEHSGDVLAFLPGVREIERCREQLAARLEGSDIAVLPLHGSLPAAEQDRVLGAGEPERRRVILATDIAETSVTIPGIRVVIDSGLTRKPRFDPGSGLTRLVTEPIARDSAAQRAGRAGRVAPGVCYRLWTQRQEQGRAAHRPAEILTADLAPLALELALWGVSGPAQLAWLDPPPAPAWEQARDLLQRLGASGEDGRLSARGRALASLPVHPRLGTLLLAAAPESRALAADLCALLSERDPLRAAPGEPRSADLGERLNALEAWRARRAVPRFDARALGQIDRVARQLRELLRDLPAGDVHDAGALLAMGYPDRIAQRRPGADGRYLLSNGSGACLPPDDALGIREHLVIAELDASGRDGRIRHALGITTAEIRATQGGRITTGEELRWDDTRNAVAARQVTRLDALELESLTRPIEDQDAATTLLLEWLGTHFDALPWSPPARQLQARVQLLRTCDPEGGWPDLTDATLQRELADWLAPWLQGKSRLADVTRLDLAEILAARLDWAHQQRLEREAPTHWQTPAGNRRPIDYASQEVPVLALPLQEMFGTTDTPRIGNGRVALQLHLLSPARRPLQITQDLAAFWEGGYAEVRKELRGRYPKHHWPEDPRHSAAIVNGVKRRRNAGN